MKAQKIQLRWSKKENDWVFNFPDNTGKTMMGTFFDMVKVETPTNDGDKGLIDMLTERGYDYRTLNIICEKLK